MKVNVLILGSGLVGSLLALSLAQQGLKVVILDTQPAFDFNVNTDGRTTAVSYGSQQIFNKLGLWEPLKKYAQPIKEIRVFEEGSAWTVDYDHCLVGPNPMGYIVENRLLRYHLQQGLKDHPLVTWSADVEIESVKRLPNKITVKLRDGALFEADILVGAEGRHSPTRQQSIIKTRTWDYHQTALVVHFYHKEPHSDFAWEIFMPSGPLAILPMLTCSKTDRYRSGLVWAKPISYDWSKVNDDELALQIKTHFPFYGDLEICSQRWTYPLSAVTVNSYIDHRLALIGDAAHVVHPIAGQGVNLGWRDAAVLADQLVRAYSLGLDIGSLTVLKQFNQKRLVDHQSVLWTTDGIHRLFGYDNSPVRFIRHTGFALVNHLPPLKKFLMRKAMGV